MQKFIAFLFFNGYLFCSQHPLKQASCSCSVLAVTHSTHTPDMIFSLIYRVILEIRVRWGEKPQQTTTEEVMRTYKRRPPILKTISAHPVLQEFRAKLWRGKWSRIKNTQPCKKSEHNSKMRKAIKPVSKHPLS